MEEKWVDITKKFNLKNQTEISDLGNVRKVLPGGKYHYYKPGMNSRGYYHVPLYCSDGVRRNMTLHRLIASVFLQKIDGYVINHKDGNPTNNAVSNLEWVTIGDNNRHGRKIKSFNRIKTLSKLQKEQIVEDFKDKQNRVVDILNKWNITRGTLRSLVEKQDKSIWNRKLYK
jgi:hypothetical protein